MFSNIDFLIIDPVSLFGEGQFNLNNIKEISVTDSFFGLDKNTRKCQNIETYDNCKTRLYIEHLKQECKCLPLSLRLSRKVTYNILNYNWLCPSVCVSVCHVIILVGCFTF